MPFKHKRTGTGIDTADPRIEHPHMDRVHLAPVSLVLCIAEAQPLFWTNMPLADSPMYGPSAPAVMNDFRAVSEFRLLVNVHTAGAAAARIGARFFSFDDEFGGWMDLSPIANASSVAVNTVGLKDTNWFAPHPEVVAEFSELYKLMIWGWGGNGVADPGFGVVALYAR